MVYRDIELNLQIQLFLLRLYCNQQQDHLDIGYKTLAPDRYSQLEHRKHNNQLSFMKKPIKIKALMG